MATKACSVKNIQHGFIMTGQIDGRNMCFPVFDTILSTCRQNPKEEEYENIEKNMTNILYHSSDYGHISEDVYDQMGVVGDRDSMGCEVLHDATISQESYQHTKCLTNEQKANESIVQLPGLVGFVGIVLRSSRAGGRDPHPPPSMHQGG